MTIRILTADGNWMEVNAATIEVDGIRYSPEVLATLGMPEGDYHISQAHYPSPEWHTKGTVVLRRLT
jgi:hypothetical protein